MNAGKMNNARRNTPAISMYLLSNSRSARPLELFHCMWCTLPVLEVKGAIDKAITTPTGDNYGNAIEVMCKRCKQKYRFVIGATVEVKQLYW